MGVNSPSGVPLIDRSADLVEGTVGSVKTEGESGFTLTHGAVTCHAISFEAAQQGIRLGKLGASAITADPIHHLRNLPHEVERLDHFLSTVECRAPKDLGRIHARARGRVHVATPRRQAQTRNRPSGEQRKSGEEMSSGNESHEKQKEKYASPRSMLIDTM